MTKLTYKGQEYSMDVTGKTPTLNTADHKTSVATVFLTDKGKFYDQVFDGSGHPFLDWVVTDEAVIMTTTYHNKCFFSFGDFQDWFSDKSAKGIVNCATFYSLDDYLKIGGGICLAYQPFMQFLIEKR